VPALPPQMRWESCLGLDLGASERKPTTGFCLVLWNEWDRKVYVERSYVKALLSPTDIANEAQRFLSQRPDTPIIVDYGGLGVGYLAEFERRFRMPVQRAQKRDKLGFRKLLNGAFQRGEVVLIQGANDQLEKELETLVWDESGTDVHKTLPDHATDALLYAWRYARAYASEDPPSVPRYGSPEWAQAEADRLEREDRERHQKRSDLPDWEKW
jgi:hypothetical protein